MKNQETSPVPFTCCHGDDICWDDVDVEKLCSKVPKVSWQGREILKVTVGLYYNFQGFLVYLTIS